jgi:DMSO/TMAO reductase YedYZ molybdopterin-dependent catalytic subunit
MNRRGFIRSILATSMGAAFAGSRLVPGGFGLEADAAAQAQAARRRAGWIIPTNTPDRFNLKVMAFNPIPAPDLKSWELTIEGALPSTGSGRSTSSGPSTGSGQGAPVRLKLADLDKLARVAQSSRLKCVQCWSGRVNWEGFRADALLTLVGARTDLLWMRVDCADKYYDFVKVEDLLHPRTLFALGMNGEALSPEHGAPLRLVMPAKYGYKSSKLITKLTFVDKGGMGLVADGWPYYSASGDILPGVDHPFEFPDETRKIGGGEITEY